ncbi:MULTISPECIES: thioesterase family protein [unclassified Mycobacterium]|uniref:thioesterase family protein n=1 Tax=unclassified Mycobacterium TaxID=2642494 RepID=UPI0029C756D0|nr:MULTISPECIES: thioesterase family protein [unclassified Mycobacterium]
MIDCLYRRLPADGDFEVFESTDGTRSNWDAEIQHGSPPLALMTKSIEELAAPALRIGRLTLDILGAIPVAPVKVRAWTVRPGARIALMCAELTPVGGERPVARVTAWLLATSDTADVASDRHRPLSEGESLPNPHAWVGAPGYLETVRWRKQATPAGASAEVWLSPLVPLVDAEPVTDVQRLALVVDSANGAGAALDPEEFLFMNTDTTVHLHRVPTGTDFGLRAKASIGPDGIGVTTADLFDRRGFIGTCAQTLLVLRR